MDKRYQARIEQALQYIEANLSERLLLADVAAVSHFSQFHFHRIFRGAMGETLNAYVARRRLETAANLLAFRADMSMTDIALACGFSSSANFAKAVKQYFGYTPSQIRTPSKIIDSKIGKLFSKYGKEFDPQTLYAFHVRGDAAENTTPLTKVQIKHLPTQTVATLASAGGYRPEALYSTWDKLINWAAGNGIAAAQQKRFAFCYDNPIITPIDKCRYEAAIVIDALLEPPAPFKKAHIPAGMYAVCEFVGSAENTQAAQLSLYAEWLPQSGFEPDQLPLLEHYLNDARDGGQVEMEIYIKLRKL